MRLRNKTLLIAFLPLLIFLSSTLKLHAQKETELEDLEKILDNNIEIDNILFADDVIDSGKLQLIQVTLVNTGLKKETVKVRIKVQNPAGKSEFLDDHTITIIGRGAEPALFQYTTAESLEGKYKVGAYIYNPKTNKLLARSTINKSPTFQGTLNTHTDELAEVRGPQAYDEERGLLALSEIEAEEQAQIENEIKQLELKADAANQTVFIRDNQLEGSEQERLPSESMNQTSNDIGNESQDNTANGKTPQTPKVQDRKGRFIDLVWQNIKLTHNSLIRGESTSLQVYLTNSGSEIAENVIFSIYISAKFLKEDYLNTDPIYKGSYSFVAPGETKLIQIPIFIPNSRPSGRYIVTGVIDPENNIEEIDEDNNISESNTLDLSEIAMVSPSNNVTVGRDSSLTFSWRSNLHTFFYIEVSQDQEFKKKDQIFQLPSGDPTPLNSLSALRGELEYLQSLAKQSDSAEFYWRVIGFDEAKNKATSGSQKLFLTYE